MPNNRGSIKRILAILLHFKAYTFKISQIECFTIQGLKIDHHNATEEIT